MNVNWAIYDTRASNNTLFRCDKNHNND